MFRKIICGIDRFRIFKEYEKLVFKYYQPFTDIVCFVVRQWLMLVQFSESFKDVLSAGTVSFGSKGRILIMQINSIFKKLFDDFEERLGFRFFWKSLVEQRFDVAQDVPETFLLAQSFDFVPVGIPEIRDENAVVSLPKMINNHPGTPAFVNMKESNIRIAEFQQAYMRQITELNTEEKIENYEENAMVY